MTKISTRLTMNDINARGYKHVVPDSLRFHNTGRYAGKQTVQIFNFGSNGKRDGTTRRIATSDLHQCAWTAARKEDIEPSMRNEIVRKLIFA